MVKDALGRKWQLGTIQVDYNLPERFELEYTGAAKLTTEAKKLGKRYVMLNCKKSLLCLLLVKKTREA